MRHTARHALALGVFTATFAAAGAQAAGLQWIPQAHPAAKVNVVLGGQEPGRPLPICRGAHNNGVHPGKIVAGKCNIGWGGKEVMLSEFEVLTGPANAIRWVKTMQGAKLPPAVFVGGQEPGRLLPVCRAAHNNGVHPGKIVAGKCNIGWGGKEIVLTSFETMTVAPALLVASMPAGMGPVSPAGGPQAKIDPLSADLAAMVASLQAEHGAGNLPALKQQVAAMHRKSHQAKWAAEALKGLKAGVPLNGKTPSGMELGKAIELAGVKSTGKAETDRKALEAVLARLRNEHQSDMAKMQQALDKRNQHFELLSDILKKLAQTQQAMVQAMR